MFLKCSLYFENQLFSSEAELQNESLLLISREIDSALVATVVMDTSQYLRKMTPHTTGNPSNLLLPTDPTAEHKRRAAKEIGAPSLVMGRTIFLTTEYEAT